MRVLYLCGYDHPSHWRKVELLADVPGLDMTVVAYPNPIKASGEYPSASGKSSYRVNIVPIRWLGHAGDPHRAIHSPAGLNLHTLRPDLIYCEHEQESLMAAEIALLRDLTAPRAPLILYSWQNILRRRSLAVRAVCAYTLRSARHIVCASDEAGDVLRRQGFRGGTSTIPMFGVDTRVFHPRPNVELRARLGLDGFVAGYVGRLVPQKGIDVLLDAVALAGAAVHAVLIGDGKARAELESRARQLGVAERCHFVPSVSHDAVADYINAMDVLVLPSRTTPNWKEQFGRVLVEAMACKVPVIGSDSGAIPEVIGDAGGLFAEGDARALASQIDRLRCDSQAGAALRVKGYERAIRHYSIEALVDRLAGAWRQVGHISNKE